MALTRLSDALNEMGNALAAAEWPVRSVRWEDGRVKIYNTKEIFKDLTYASIEAENKTADLRDCVNELCLLCGQYKEEHLGACDGCRWKKVKEGFR